MADVIQTSSNQPISVTPAAPTHLGVSPLSLQRIRSSSCPKSSSCSKHHSDNIPC
jgi:hypothetical protein